MKAKKGLRIFLIVSIVIMTLFAIGNGGWSMLENNHDIPDYDHSYYIQDYNIEMVVSENNTVYVEEVITAIFKESGKHGIYRNIPLTHSMDIEENGETKTINQVIKDYDVEGNQNAVMTYQDANLVIRMGDPDAYQVVGEPSIFTIAYTLDLGKDYAETFDMFYYNIIGSGWQVPIHNLNYKILMPNEFDTTQL